MKHDWGKKNTLANLQIKLQLLVLTNAQYIKKKNNINIQNSAVKIPQ